MTVEESRAHAVILLDRLRTADEDRLVDVVTEWLEDRLQAQSWAGRLPRPEGLRQEVSDERRIEDIDGELSCSLPLVETRSVSFSWYTVEFLVRMVRKRDERVSLLLRHVTAAFRQLTAPNTRVLDGHPAVIDVRRLLRGVEDAEVLDRAIAEGHSVLARAKMEAYRAGLADRS